MFPAYSWFDGSATDLDLLYENLGRFDFCSMAKNRTGSNNDDLEDMYAAAEVILNMVIEEAVDLWKDGSASYDRVFVGGSDSHDAHETAHDVIRADRRLLH